MEVQRTNLFGQIMEIIGLQRDRTTIFTEVALLTLYSHMSLICSIETKLYAIVVSIRQSLLVL